MSALVNFFFSMTNTIKLYHWTTMIHARHVAADKLYENIVDLSDKFMETYMGIYGRPKMAKTNKVITEYQTDASILKFLNECKDFLTKDLEKYVPATNTDLWNIKDEILAKINQTIYLFTLE